MTRTWIPLLLLAVLPAVQGLAQEKSVRPGVNDTFRDPNVKEFIEKFEIESREVFAKRAEITQALGIKPGATVADIGAGTGIFTRLFSDKVGSSGQVLAVDIAENFLDHVNKINRETGRKNVQTVLCTADDTKLPRRQRGCRVHLRHLSSLRVSFQDDDVAAQSAQAWWPGLLG